MVNDIQIWQLSPNSIDTLSPVTLYPPPTSVDDASKRLPGGGYTTFRTFGRKRVMRLEDHFHRLEETARLAGHPIQLDRARIRKALGIALDRYPRDEARIRVVIDLVQIPGTLYLMLEPLHLPTEADVKHGVSILTRTMHRDNPKAKLTGFIDTAAAIRQSLPAGINEVVMIGEDGRVLEGLSSNFFAVKDGVIWTAEQGVLSGITRSLVLKAIQELGLPLQLEGLPAIELAGISEAFITSASRAVLPVTEIDGKAVGVGVPGPATHQLAERYQQLVDQMMEDLP